MAPMPHLNGNGNGNSTEMSHLPSEPEFEQAYKGMP